MTPAAEYTSEATAVEAGLLAAILAVPEDDAPRLVYADWLDENARGCCRLCGGKGRHESGYVRCDVRGVRDTRRSGPCLGCSGTGRGEVSDGKRERAEFIRLQIELARLPDCLTPSVGTTTDGKPLACRECRPRDKRDCLPWCRVCQQHGDLSRRERGSWDAWAVPGIEKAMAARGPWFDLPGRVVGHWPCGVTIKAPDEETRCEFRRGFVAAVSLPTAAFVGGQCPRCHGTGQYDWAGAEVECSACSGTGHTVGLAAELARRHPLTEVRLTDAEPWAWEPASFTPSVRFSWVNNENEQRGTGDEERQRAHVPGVLFAELTRLPGAEIRFGEYARYDSADAAHDALSRAACRYARAAAKEKK